MLKRFSVVTMTVALSGCSDAEPSSFALCSGALGLTREISIDVQTGYARHSDLIGRIEPCSGADRPCMEFPFPLSQPPKKFRTGTEWKAGNYFFRVNSFNSERLLLLAVDRRSKLNTFIDYDFETGVRRIALPGGKELYKCHGQLMLYQLP